MEVLDSAYTTVYLLVTGFIILGAILGVKHSFDLKKKKEETKKRKEKTYSSNKKKRLGIG